MFEKFEKKHYFYLGAILAVLAILAYAFGISQDDVTLSTPAAGTWTNLSNYTAGYNFSWNDADDASYSTANCTLYMSTSSNLLSVLGAANAKGSIISTRNTVTNIPANNDITNQSANYWTVKCFNTSSLDAQSGGFAPDVRAIYHDNETPAWTIIDYSFTNNTWITTSSVRFQVNVTDAGYEGSSSHTVKIINNSNSYAFATGTTTDGTPINITATLSDANYTLEVSVCDPASNCNSTALDYTVRVDTVAPASLSFVSPTVASGGNTSNTWMYVNFTFVEARGVSAVIVTWDGTNTTITGANLTSSGSTYNGFYNFTGLSVKRNKQYNVTINDTAGNVLVSSTRTFSVDTGSPSFAEVNNITVSSGTASYRINVTDTTPYTCQLKLYNGGSLKSTKTGTWGTVGATTNCTGTFSYSDINADGAFTMEYNVADEAGNTNTTNMTGIATTLYSGWNIVTWGDGNNTVANICSQISSCTQVSWYNNSAGTFTTYSTSTPTVNNATQVNPDDGVFIYVSADSNMIRNDYMPASGNARENITINTQWWNVMGLLGGTNANATLYAAAFNTTYNTLPSLRNITWVGYLNSSSGKYYTCSRSANLCAGTTTAPINLSITKGQGVIVLTDGNVTLNRTRLI